MTTGLFPNVTSIAVDATVYADAGAPEADELAYSIATAVEYLRVLVDGGLSIRGAVLSVEAADALGIEVGASVTIELPDGSSSSGAWLAPTRSGAVLR